MEYLPVIIIRFLSLTINIFQIALMIRYFIELLGLKTEGVFFELLCVITNPVLNFFSFLLGLIGIKDDGPMNYSVILAVFVTWLLDLCLSTAL